MKLELELPPDEVNFYRDLAAKHGRTVSEEIRAILRDNRLGDSKEDRISRLTIKPSQSNNWDGVFDLIDTLEEGAMPDRVQPTSEIRNGD